MVTEPLADLIRHILRQVLPIRSAPNDGQVVSEPLLVHGRRGPFAREGRLDAFDGFHDAEKVAADEVCELGFGPTSAEQFGDLVGGQTRRYI